MTSKFAAEQSCKFEKPMTDVEKFANLDNAFAEFLAKMLCVRPTLFVKSGHFLSWINQDAPSYDARRPTCKSCDADISSESHKALCSACSKAPILINGAPIITTMYRSGNPRYVLSEENESIVANIRQQRQIADDSFIVCEKLCRWSYEVHERAMDGKGNLNVLFTKELMYSGGSYETKLTFRNPRFLDDQVPHNAVTVGGLGPKLFEQVFQSAVKWLNCLDQMIRTRFKIPLGGANGDVSFKTCLENYAKLIANRVVLLEPESRNPSQRLCTRACEHIANLQVMRCHYFATEVIESDIENMGALAKLAKDCEFPKKSAALLGLLKSPPPELLKKLPTVAIDMEFDRLCNALGEGDSIGKIKEWCASVNTGALCVLLEQAITESRQWTPLFLNCLRYDKVPLKDHLPNQAWVDNPHIACWSLKSKISLSQRRTGLDATGLRIVLMSNALLELNGNDHFFLPGVLKCDIMNRTVHGEMALMQFAHSAFSEQIQPYMAGAEWKYSRAEVVEWQGSHIEDEVRRAAASLGGFSVVDIKKRFLNDGLGGTSNQATMEKIVCQVQRKMIYKPEQNYDQWFPISVKLLVPIIAQMRNSIGIADHVPTNPIGDLLRLLKKVRDWKPEDGTLKISVKEIYYNPKVKDLLLTLERDGSSNLALRQRVGTVMFWKFEKEALQLALR